MLHGRGPADGFFDQACGVGCSIPVPFKQSRVFRKLHDRTCRGGRRCVMACCRHDHIISIGLPVRDWRAVDHACGNDRCQIVTRIGAAVRCDGTEISFEIGDHKLQHLDCLFRAGYGFAGSVDFWVCGAE